MIVGGYGIDSLVELTRVKTATRSQDLVSRKAVLQASAARAEALVDSGRAFLYQTLEDG